MVQGAGGLKLGFAGDNETVSAGGKPLVPYILTPPFSFPSLVLPLHRLSQCPRTAPPLPKKRQNSSVGCKN